MTFIGKQLNFPSNKLSVNAEQEPSKDYSSIPAIMIHFFLPQECLSTPSTEEKINYK
jgi:hypothetical protein